MNRILELKRESLELRAKVERLERSKESLSATINWLENRAPTLQCPNTSAWHKLADSWAGDKIEFVGPATTARPVGVPHVILIQHDWASLIPASDDPGAEWCTPFPFCAFEFVVSGRRAIELHDHGSWTSYVNDRDVWYALHTGAGPHFQRSDSYPLVNLINDNVRAACIALDAEVVAEVVSRAPHRLNRSRETKGLAPLADFHTLSIARRARAMALGEPSSTGSKKRLHFRRGHWRHFENHKTWIKWQLVGNPDLGFIDKQYRL